MTAFASSRRSDSYSSSRSRTSQSPRRLRRQALPVLSGWSPGQLPRDGRPAPLGRLKNVHSFRKGLTRGFVRPPLPLVCSYLSLSPVKPRSHNSHIGCDGKRSLPVLSGWPLRQFCSGWSPCAPRRFCFLLFIFCCYFLFFFSWFGGDIPRFFGKSASTSLAGLPRAYVRAALCGVATA